jgi:hypothetical protein
MPIITSLQMTLRTILRQIKVNFCRQVTLLSCEAMLCHGLAVASRRRAISVEKFFGHWQISCNSSLIEFVS